MVVLSSSVYQALQGLDALVKVAFANGIGRIKHQDDIVIRIVVISRSFVTTTLTKKKPFNFSRCNSARRYLLKTCPRNEKVLYMKHPAKHFLLNI